MHEDLLKEVGNCNSYSYSYSYLTATSFSSCNLTEKNYFPQLLSEHDVHL
jgi:hypothetical protein